MTGVDGALAAFEPISLSDANDVALLQTRVDRKYVVDANTLELLLARLAPTTRVLAIHGERAGSYRSTYLDTSDLDLYRAAATGRRRRSKVRVRTYGTNGPSFLEVKQKGMRGCNVKTRIEHDGGGHDTMSDTGRAFIDSTTGITGLAAALRPVLTTRYERSTLVDTEQHTRLTLDRSLRCDDLRGGAAHFDGIVLETKSSGAPSEADRWLWHHHIRPAKISKFCSGLAAVRPDLPHNKWHRLLARHWRVDEVVRIA